MSFTLKITKKSGEHYWTDYFESKEKLEKWLELEKTRPYWDESFVVEIIEPVIDEAKEKEKKDFEEKKKKESKEKKQKIKEILKLEVLTQDQIKDALRFLLKHIDSQVPEIND